MLFCFSHCFCIQCFHQIVLSYHSRTTTRVKARPGGASSLTFGILPSPSPKKEEEAKLQPKGEEDEEVAKKEEGEETLENAKATEEVAAATAAAASSSTSSSKQPPTSSKPQSANAFVSGSNMNGGCVMTDRPTSRVLAPPGGHTSIKLG